MDNNKKSNNVSIKNSNNSNKTKNNKNNNKNTNNSKSQNKSNYLTTFYIITGLLVLLFLFYYYQDYLFGSSFTSKSYQVFADEMKVDETFEVNVEFSEFIGKKESLFLDGEGNDISFYWEMKVPNIQGNEPVNSNSNKYKPLISFGSGPTIYYHPRKSILDFVVKYKDNPNYPKFSHTQVEIAQQRWNQFLCVIRGKLIFIYINGQLVKSNTLGNIPYIATSPKEMLKVGDKNNNIIGKIRNLTIFFYAEKPENI